LHAAIADINTTNKYLTEDRDEQQGQHAPPATQVHVDAAINQVPARYERRKAGLGVHIQGEIQGNTTELLIQATHVQAQDPLHAEALVLQLS
jgi:hypothetical protein